MTATPAPAAPSGSAGPLRAPPPFPDWELIAAEILKVRRRLGLMIVSILLTVGTMVIAYTVMASLHAANPVAHSPAGGTSHFLDVFHALALFSFIAAVLIGATCGAGDIAAGVFRMLVATGRRRAVLFAARLPAGLVVLFVLVVAAFVLSCVLTVVLAGGLPVPSDSFMVKIGLWLLLQSGMQFLLALGVGSAIGSRSTTIPLVLAFDIILTPLIEGLSGFNWFRELFLGVALDQLAPARVGFAEHMLSHLHMTTAAAVTVVVVWGVGLLALGAWSTVRRDA